MELNYLLYTVDNLSTSKYNSAVLEQKSIYTISITDYNVKVGGIFKL